MGQQTFAILYGIEQPEGVDLFGEDGDDGLVGEWEKACGARIRRYEERHPRTSWQMPRGSDVYVPDSPYESHVGLLGFYVAVGASGKAGIPALEGCALADVRTEYADSYKAARRRWGRFAKWCRAEGIVLPKARLYLTETEVG